jgi:hypothetical protein
MRSASALHHSRQLAVELAVSELRLSGIDEFDIEDIGNTLFCPGRGSSRAGVFFCGIDEGGAH